jgi:hypothetical protein
MPSVLLALRARALALLPAATAQARLPRTFGLLAVVLIILHCAGACGGTADTV